MNKDKSLTEALKSRGQFSYRNQEILEIARGLGIDHNDAYKVIRKMYKLSRGVYTLDAPSAPTPAAEPTPSTAIANHVELRGVASVANDEIYVPSVDPTYIKWGEYNTIMKIIKSKLFFPVYVSGLSGNGKTMMIEQACAKAKREYVRVQISPETDEDDLIGGFRLINGETVFQKGPIIKAMERGCLLLIDEIDRATNKIMCLQGVLEGNPVLLKKTGQVVTPAEGFNVIATANTKGRGSDDGRFTAASIIDDAFLERFVCAIDQEFPSPMIEKKIVMAHMSKFGVEAEEFCDKLIAWSNVIRKTFDADGVDEIISTRRLCHIVKTFSIFEDRAKAISMCISRFDEETRTAFLDLYTKIDESQLTEDGEVVEFDEFDEIPQDLVNQHNEANL
jgi:MoxR-like ATPase